MTNMTNINDKHDRHDRHDKPSFTRLTHLSIATKLSPDLNQKPLLTRDWYSGEIKSLQKPTTARTICHKLPTRLRLSQLTTVFSPQTLSSTNKVEEFGEFLNTTDVMMPFIMCFYFHMEKMGGMETCGKAIDAFPQSSSTVIALRSEKMMPTVSCMEEN